MALTLGNGPGLSGEIQPRSFLWRAVPVSVLICLGPSISPMDLLSFCVSGRL